MDDFKIIYRILKYLCESMDYDEFDSEGFTAARFGTNDNRFRALKGLLRESGYITGPITPRITLTGLEYLHENTMMKKAAKIV